MDETQSGAATPDTVRNPDTDYEPSDLPLRPAALIALALALLLLVSPLVLLYAFREVREDVSRDLRVLPPQPRLQTDPRRDLQRELARQRVFLDSYGWVDPKHDIARVPVSVAMEHVAEMGIDGFPARSARSTQP